MKRFILLFLLFAPIFLQNGFALESSLVSCQLDNVVYILYLRQKNYDKVQNHIKQNRT